MASDHDYIPARRSRRLAGLEPSKVSNGIFSEGKRNVKVSTPVTIHRTSVCLTRLTNPGVSNRREEVRSNESVRHTLVPMVHRRIPPVTSDTASQTTESIVEQPLPGSSSSSSSSLGDDPQQPSTSRGMGAALSAVVRHAPSPGGENESRQARRRRVRRARRAMLDAYRGIPSSSPVKGESYCDCPKQGRDLTCSCGEEDNVFDWCWDPEQKSAACDLSEERRMSIFHMSYSSGTAAVRGTQPMTDRQYFWEIKMTSPVYGTDMMVGVGTANVNLSGSRHAFTSLLGRDAESWGLSYYGRIQHKGNFDDIRGGKFGQGTILGVHVDMWHGTVSYYKNRRPLGVAYRGLAGKTLYPMVASTAARTAMKVIKACSFQTSLQFLCCQVLRKLVPSDQNVIKALALPPGLRAFLENNLSWLLRPSELSREPQSRGKRAWTPSDSSSSSSGDETDLEEDDGPPSKRLRTLVQNRERMEGSSSSAERNEETSRGVGRESFVSIDIEETSGPLIMSGGEELQESSSPEPTDVTMQLVAVEELERNEGTLEETDEEAGGDVINEEEEPTEGST